MAFPPMIPMSEEGDGRSIREQIISDQPFCTLTQNSAHLENWLWGAEPPRNIPDEDHDPGIPVVKVSYVLARNESLVEESRFGVTIRLNTTRLVNMNYSLLTLVVVDLRISKNM